MDERKPRHPDEVRNAITKSAISKAELARRAGVHANTLATVESAEWSPRWKTLEALCLAADAIRSERG
jgi:lambda repressor-like predicted transcriptional regulator